MPSTDPLIANTVEKLYPDIRAFRETLHQYPELSWEEHETTERIIAALNTPNIPPFQRITKTGGMVDFIYREGAPFVLLRADIDALPIQDEIEKTYKSTREGICHACAHDAHTATVVGVGKALQALPDLSYNLRLLFQPAEEPIPSGAPTMIAAGALKDVKLALGMHMEPRLPYGTISITPGWVNMQSIRLDLSFTGKGGHSARPNETADLLWIASRFIQDSYQTIYRRINLLDSTVVLTFTEIQAKQGYNVIPNALSLTGTLRLSDPAKKTKALKHIRELAEFLAKDNDCEINLTVEEGSPAIYNDPNLVSLLQTVVQEDMSEEIILNREFRTPGGDDFSNYLEEVPGVMVRFGVRSEETKASLHEGLFDLPADTLKISTAFFLSALQRLTP